MPDLLAQYNPTLVIYPHDPLRDRPGAFRPRKGWGDYHPCTAEFFIERSVRRDCPERYDIVSGILSRFRGDSLQTLTPDGLAAARAFISASRPEQSAGWELDVCAIPSQDPGRAWRAYAEFLHPAAEAEDSAAKTHRCVTYARAVPSALGTVLQYWYLYVYNDFLNHHEGDWEMVTISLDPQDRPVEVAYSNHHGGVRRLWEHTPRVGDSPLVYVARGSHAGYFRFASGGHALVGDLSTGKVPPALFFLKYLRQAANFVIRWVQRVPGIRLFRDNPPADPVLDTDAPHEKVGVRVRPEVIRLPDPDIQANPDPDADADFWWMRYRGYWGSTRPRVTGSVGVIGPWASTSPRDLRWREPAAWMATCKQEDGHGFGELMERVAEETAEIVARGKAKVAGRK